MIGDFLPAKKKPKKESIRNDVEKEIMYGFKEEFLKRDVKLETTYKVDRGKLIRSWIEGGLLDISGFKKRDLKKAVDAIGVVIYRRAYPHEKPLIIFFVGLLAKRSVADDANEYAGIFKKLFPGLTTAFVALDPEPEKLPKGRYKNLDEIIVGKSLEEIWNKAKEFISETLGIKIEEEEFKPSELYFE